MTHVTISLNSSGHGSAMLSAGVGNDLSVSWVLTDTQLAYLAAQAVSIIETRNRMGLFNAEEMKGMILKALSAGPSVGKSDV